MRALKSLFNWSFALAAMLLAPASIIAPVQMLRLGYIPFSFSTCAIFAVPLAISGLYAAAWWTTRKSRATRSPLAIAACFVTIGIIVFQLGLTRPSSFTVGAVNMLLISVSIAGMVVFARLDTLPIASPGSTKRARVPGDRTHPWMNKASTIIFIAALWPLMGHWYRWAHTHHLAKATLLPSLILLGLAILATLVVHECGHILAGYPFKMKVLSIAGGPFRWKKVNGKWGFKFTRARLLNFNGAVGIVPTHPDQPRWQDICMVAGGPSANICVGLLAGWAASRAQGTFYQPAWEDLTMTSSICLAAACCNLVPFLTTEGSYSDGARILQLVTNSPMVELQRTIIRIQSTLVTSLRPRDMDIDAIQRAARRFPQELTGLGLHLCAAKSFEDLGQFGEARASLAEAEAVYSDSIDLPVSTHTIFVFQHACLNCDATAARLWWNRMIEKKPERLDVDYWLARTALLWIEGRIHEAEQAWQNAAAEAQALPSFGAYDLDRARCALLRQQLDQPSQADRKSTRLNSSH